MKTHTAANLLGLDPNSLSKSQRISISKMLNNNQSALMLAALELRRLKRQGGASGSQLLSNYNSGNPQGGLTDVGQRSTLYLREIASAMGIRGSFGNGANADDGEWLAQMKAKMAMERKAKRDAKGN
jgi:hypothetical protein